MKIFYSMENWRSGSDQNENYTIYKALNITSELRTFVIISEREREKNIYDWNQFTLSQLISVDYYYLLIIYYYHKMFAMFNVFNV